MSGCIFSPLLCTLLLIAFLEKVQSLAFFQSKAFTKGHFVSLTNLTVDALVAISTNKCFREFQLLKLTDILHLVNVSSESESGDIDLSISYKMCLRILFILPKNCLFLYLKISLNIFSFMKLFPTHACFPLYVQLFHCNGFRLYAYLICSMLDCWYVVGPICSIIELLSGRFRSDWLLLPSASLPINELVLWQGHMHIESRGRG